MTDHIDKLSHNGIVYKISCNDCNATYIGQTKRQLKTRVQEHKRDIKSNTSPSVTSRHCSEFNHNFDWGRVEIMDEERSYSKRLTSEMIFIKRQKSGINKQSDTNLLPASYTPIINLLPPIWFLSISPLLKSPSPIPILLSHFSCISIFDPYRHKWYSLQLFEKSYVNNTYILARYHKGICILLSTYNKKLCNLLD